MGKKIRIIIALVVMVGVLYWSFSLVRERSYSGSKLAFEVGSGSVAVTHRGQEPIPVEMRAEGRGSTFQIESTELGLRERSTRQSSGPTTYHAVAFELPSGQAQIRVTRGSNVFFISESTQPIQAVVTPMSEGSARTIIIVAALICIGALYYISRTLDHRWIGTLRGKLSRRKQNPEGASA